MKKTLEIMCFFMYNNDMRNYALVAKGITYMQRIGSNVKYVQPQNITGVAEYLKLLLSRGIFVDLLTDKKVNSSAPAKAVAFIGNHSIYR